MQYIQSVADKKVSHNNIILQNQARFFFPSVDANLKTAFERCCEKWKKQNILSRILGFPFELFNGAVEHLSMDYPKK